MTVAGEIEEAVLGRHTAAWQIGTGVRLALAPGRYKITGRVELSGREYVELDRLVRVDLSDAQPQ